ncbi:MAG: biotin--[acetyl-CoA-carboxylase] ligase [Acidimicrobiia bacterium]
MATPYALVSLRRATSTQDEARARYRDTPVLVVAAGQTAGRGRGGRGWVNAPRSAAISLAFQPTWPAATWGRLPLVAGLAARRDLQGAVELKWPNDLMVGDRKAGGILVEASGSLVVVGVGLNLWWPNPPEGMVGVWQDDPGEGAERGVGQRWADEFLARIDRAPEEWGRSEYRAACRTLGRPITWDPDGRGVAVDVAEDGSLVVETPSGIEHLRSGEVRQVRAV